MDTLTLPDEHFLSSRLHLPAQTINIWIDKNINYGLTSTRATPGSLFVCCRPCRYLARNDRQTNPSSSHPVGFTFTETKVSDEWNHHSLHTTLHCALFLFLEISRFQTKHGSSKLRDLLARRVPGSSDHNCNYDDMSSWAQYCYWIRIWLQNTGNRKLVDLEGF